MQLRPNFLQEIDLWLSMVELEALLNYQYILNWLKSTANSTEKMDTFGNMYTEWTQEILGEGEGEGDRNEPNAVQWGIGKIWSV